MATKKKSTKKSAPKKSTKPDPDPAESAPEAAEAPAEAEAEGSAGGAEAGASREAARATESAPVPTVTMEPNARDAVYDAAFLEARERGLSDREARSLADEVCDRLRFTAREDNHEGEPEATFYDLRAKQDYVYPGGKRKVRTVDRQHSVPFMRDPKTVDAIVIHQTACEFGVSRAMAKRFGNVETARAHRALDVACHALAFRNGYFVAAHDLRVYVNHGNRLNARSLGLEIEGRYPGLMDDPDTVAREDLRTTWGGEPTVLTDKTVETARAALKWLVEEGRKYGMPIKYIFAHRQSSDHRRSDPGEELWKRVVLDYAVAELGLETMPETRWRQGYSIPKEWDPDGKGKY